MRFVFIFLLLVGYFHPAAQTAENIIIVTMDGLRWQELFKGLDTALANDKEYNEGDSLYIYQKYHHKDVTWSRELLMPFLWSE